MKLRYPRAFKHLAQASGTHLWRAGFSLSSYVRRPSAAPWSSAGDERVLVVAPHPDDETAGCAGTILRHREAADPVTVVCMTDGRRSSALGLAPEAMAAARHQEAATVAALLDFDLAWQGLVEGAWSLAEGARALTTAIARVQPTRIYAPTCIDFHPEHRKTANALASALALRREACHPTIHGYAVSVPFRAAMIDQIVPVARYERRIHAAFDAYASQRGALEPALRLRRYLASRFRIAVMAEGFWTRSASCYCRLHAEASDGGGARGMRYSPWTDPLAFLSASRLRRALARREPPTDRCHS